MAAELERVTTEILAVSGRTLEPFIKVFKYSGENVTSSALGSIVGVFEVSERSEDSAYIVNFLASVAKKEYFSNPRRGPIESFEASLHKINLALAELVKHGNIAWLGKFHGVIGILEKNNIHFSATGEAKILLLRDRQLSEISAGLASEESSIHPIKTFSEVSSGRLMADDKIILTSPELFTLLSLEDVEKNALRMDSERFAQFLRTALTNELDLAGTIIIDITIGKPVRPPKKKEINAEEPLYNVFSQQTFIPNVRAEPENTPSQIAPPSEYTDSKTGHIYVQGGAPEKSRSHPSIEQAELLLQDIGHTAGMFFGSYGKLLRKGKKQSFIFFSVCGTYSLRIAQKSLRFIGKKLTKSPPKLAATIHSFRSPEKPSVKENTDQAFSSKAAESQFSTVPVPGGQKRRAAILAPTATENNDDIPPFLKEKIALFSQKNVPSHPPIAPRSPLSKALSPSEKSKGALLLSSRVFQTIIRESSRRSAAFFLATGVMLYRAFRHAALLRHNLDRQQKKTTLIGGGILLILGIGIFALTRPKEEAPTASLGDMQEEQPIVPSFPIDSEKNATVLNEPTVAAQEADTITSVLLRDATYLITRSGIFSVENKTHSALPTGSGTPLFAAPMNDLQLIFLYTDTQELFVWNPVNRAFVKNTLTLPPGASVKAIGTYLTYLYVLDGTANQIYRYPRAEGGFGESVSWLKDPLTFGEQPLMAISENLFLSTTRETIQSFLQGRFVKNLESPATALAVTDIWTARDATSIYALDNRNKRILVWNQDGTLLKQYFSESLADARSIAVNEKISEAFVTTSNSLLSFQLKP